MKSEKAARAAEKNKREEMRSKTVREFLLSFQLSIIQLVPEMPRNQCEGVFYVCVIVLLNGAIGPRLDNEPRPFAVTPPHQGDTEGGEERKNKSGMSERREGRKLRSVREKEEEEGRRSGGKE